MNDETKTNKENTIVLVVGDVGGMNHEQRLDCCRQLALRLGLAPEAPDPPPHPAFPDSLFLCDGELKKTVNNCSDINTLLALYIENRYRMERQPLLEQLFANRRRELEEIYCCTGSENLG